MQISVKTLTCGSITLDVKARATIELVRKKIISKIDDMFTGFDVEILEYVESNHGLVFAGKLLEDGRTLSDYNIKSDNTIHMTSTLDGAGTFIHFHFISFHFCFVLETQLDVILLPCCHCCCHSRFSLHPSALPNTYMLI